ncbi:hypothetical protein GG496_000519 [Candidatus Fervidibacteria bacterium JGI MDM2 JNZ-1-D12]
MTKMPPDSPDFWSYESLTTNEFVAERLIPDGILNDRRPSQCSPKRHEIGQIVQRPKRHFGVKGDALANDMNIWVKALMEVYLTWQ